MVDKRASRVAGRNNAIQFILKVASRCNLNCSYCYVYNKGDESWRQRPPIMSDEVFTAALNRIQQHCLRSQQRQAFIAFHGGEPCLIGTARFASWCDRIKTALADIVDVHISLQTNGTLLNSEWIDLFLTHDVDVGISLDGPKDLHDTHRVDHQGHGSYDAVEKGIALLRQAGIPVRILSVIQLGEDGLCIHRHLLDLGANWINYLLPDFTHNTIAPIRQQYGLTPCADFLMPIFDDWWFRGTLEVKIHIFWNIARLILGGNSEVDMFGNQPFRFVFIESDGAIEGLDVLRVCRKGFYQTGLNVLTDDIDQIAQVSDLHRAAILEGMPLPTPCRGCPEQHTCAGGYLPHRYSTSRGFDNSTVWCADLLHLFRYMREKLEVPVEETMLRRQVLRSLSVEGDFNLDGDLALPC